MSRLIRPTRLVALTLLLALSAAHASGAQDRRTSPKPSRQTYKLTREDEALIEDLSRRAFQYFVDHADAHTGLVLDRARTSGEPPPAGHPSHQIASSAATGFGLTALCIGAERGWMARDEAREAEADEWSEGLIGDSNS